LSLNFKLQEGKAMKRRFLLIAVLSFCVFNVTEKISYAAEIHITSGGDVGIGTAAPQSKLAVNGTITAKEIKVTDVGWADYIFSNKYHLAPIEEVEKYISEYKHLPGIPAEETVSKAGVSVSEMFTLHMTKIEELTLYVIQLNQENKILKERIHLLEQR
jgi:hypothetical protein